MTVEKKQSNDGRTAVERPSNDGTTRLVDRCDRVENAHASYHVDARVHVRPVFSGGVIICWHCSSQSNGTIQDYCMSVMAIRQSLKKAQEQARNSKPLLHSACSEASICKGLFTSNSLQCALKRIRIECAFNPHSIHLETFHITKMQCALSNKKIRNPCCASF